MDIAPALAAGGSPPPQPSNVPPDEATKENASTSTDILMDAPIKFVMGCSKPIDAAKVTTDQVLPTSSRRHLPQSPSGKR